MKSLSLSLLIPCFILSATTYGAQAGNDFLFVGNSFTYYNDMPLMVAEMMQHRNSHAPKVAAITAPGVGLDYWIRSGSVKKRLQKSKQWKFVILQERSDFPFRNPEGMRNSIERLSSTVKTTGAQPVLFMTWCDKNRASMQPLISKTYRTIAKDAGCRLVPCGDVWRSASAARKRFDLYDIDEHHPSELGSYLNACCFYTYLLGKSPIGLPYRFKTATVDTVTISLNAQDAAAIQKIVWDEYRKRPRLKAER